MGITLRLTFGPNRWPLPIITLHVDHAALHRVLLLTQRACFPPQAFHHCRVDGGLSSLLLYKVRLTPCVERDGQRLLPSPARPRFCPVRPTFAQPQ